MTNRIYGPLQALIGVWTGDKGMDIAPEPDGSEENPFYETITYQPIGDVTNAESQTLVALHYRQIVQRTANDAVFHDQTGYWMWDESTQTVMHSLLIPRGVGLLAGGHHQVTADDHTILEVAAAIDDANWGIIQSPFMQQQARTTAFRQRITIAHGTLTYAQTTMVDIYGKVFEHTDQNSLCSATITVSG
ncbi:MAG: heme-binding beta-barrel domain-containing protein [Mariprofundales bacterium]